MKPPTLGTQIFPPIEIKGQTVNIGRIIRFLAGIAIVVKLVFFEIPADEWSLGLMVFLAAALLDHKLVVELAGAWRRKSGNG